jgi:hypothetical protein
MPIPEVERAVGVALQIHAQWNLLRREERKHFVTPDLVNEVFGPEGSFLGGMGLREQECAQIFGIHCPDAARKRDVMPAAPGSSLFSTSIDVLARRAHCVFDC